MFNVWAETDECQRSNSEAARRQILTSKSLTLDFKTLSCSCDQSESEVASLKRNLNHFVFKRQQKVAVFSSANMKGDVQASSDSSLDVTQQDRSPVSADEAASPTHRWLKNIRDSSIWKIQTDQIDFV